jgi:hypothetical protein
MSIEDTVKRLCELSHAVKTVQDDTSLTTGEQQLRIEVYRMQMSTLFFNDRSELLDLLREGVRSRKAPIGKVISALNGSFPYPKAKG